jgi:hypothetical protein
MARDSVDQTFDDEEAERRFSAALRGARIAAPMPMKDIVGKRRKSRVKKTVQAKPK